MKFGIRKPSIKKSLKARTTSKLKKKMKRAVNPFYGKKGMGFINNPKKAIYNKIYNKTTVDSRNIFNINKKEKIKVNNNQNVKKIENIKNIQIILPIILIFISVMTMPEATTDTNSNIDEINTNIVPLAILVS